MPSSREGIHGEFTYSGPLAFLSFPRRGLPARHDASIARIAICPRTASSSQGHDLHGSRHVDENRRVLAVCAEDNLPDER